MVSAIAVDFAVMIVCNSGLSYFLAGTSSRVGQQRHHGESIKKLLKCYLESCANPAMGVEKSILSEHGR